MKTEKNILLAFLLNLAFSIFEFFGGIFTHSVAILSDAIHDIGDAISIGIAFFLEKVSKKEADEKHTYGYARYSVLGSFITTIVLLFGSILVIYNAVKRIANPVEINYDGMILFAVVGVCINFLAALLTREGNSLNQKAVNLHMLEDVLGWLVVLVGSVVMRFTDFYILDPLMSIGVTLFILINAMKNLKEVGDLFLEKTPNAVEVKDIAEHLCEIEDVVEIHHIHVWSLDGHNHCATLHVVINGNGHTIKEKVRKELQEHGIIHATIEIEEVGEACHEKAHPSTPPCPSGGHHHHHH